MIWKKRFAFFVVLICFSLFGIMVYDVYAASAILTFDYVNSWIATSDNGSSSSLGKSMRVGNQVAYCIEPGIEISYGKSYEEVSYTDVGINESLAKRLSLIGAYGYGYIGRTSSDWEAITQGLIWKEMGYDRYFLTDTINTKEKLQEKWDQIVYDVDRYYLLPEFNQASFVLKVNEQLVLEDRHLVLKDMEIIDSGGLEVSIQDNQLIISATNQSKEKESIIFKKKLPQSKKASSFWYHPQWQKLASFSVSDEVTYEMIIHVEKDGELKLFKQNQYQELIDGAIVKVFNEKYSQTVEIKNGEVVLDNLEAGNYQIQEISAPSGYLLDSTIYEIEIYPSETTTFKLENQEPTASLSIKKIDKETTIAQGDAKLTGAKYGLYAKEDIYNASKKQLLFNKNDLVGTLTTDNNAVASLDKIPLGNYYLKEITPSIGYLLDDTVYDVSFQYKDQHTSMIVESLVVEETVMKQPLKIIKISSENSEIAKGIQGIEFEIKLKSQVEELGYDDAVLYDQLLTDENGEALSIHLPYGVYIVREVNTPSSLLPIKDFEIEISSANNQVLQYIVNNQSFESYIKIVKKDIDTNQRILYKDASFKLFDIDHNTYVTQKLGDTIIDTFTTNQDGVVTTPLKLPYGNYRIEETKAPYGYLLNQEGYEFKAEYYGQIEIDQDGDYILIFEVFDKQVRGTIEISKVGEVLIGYQNDDFVYEKKGLQGAIFELYAAESIFSMDTNQLIFQENEKIATATSDSNGKAIFSDLPLGNYYIKEITAPNGYILSKEKYQVELLYKDEHTSIVVAATSIENVREKMQVDILKTDKDSKENLCGVEYAIYNQNDIYDYQGNVVFEKNSLIEIMTTNQEGKAVNQKDLPKNEYYVKEYSALVGYVKDEEIYPIGLSTLHLENTKTIVDISKIDITTSKELEGASMQLLDSQGNIVDEWISSSSPHRIRGLSVAETYTLVERIQPYGFTISNQVTFSVENTKEIQKVEMYDDLKFGRLHFNKQGEQFFKVEIVQSDFGNVYQPMFEIAPLLEAEITIYAAEDIILGNGIKYYSRHQEVAIVSSLESISQLLVVGKYYAVETKVPNGYLQDNTKHYFEISDDGNIEIQDFYLALHNQRGKLYLHLNKVLEQSEILLEDTDSYKDVLFGIYTNQDLYINDQIAIEKDSLVAISGINQNGGLLEEIDLPFASYYIKELQTANNYQLLEEIFYFSLEYQGKDVHEYHIYINEGNEIINSLKKSDIGILKIDADNEAIQLSGATFTLYNQNYQPLLTSISDYQGFAYMENIPYGKYYLKETVAPDSYIIDNNYYEVIIDESVERDNYIFLTIKNQHYRAPLLNDDIDKHIYQNLFYGITILIVFIYRLKYKLVKE